MVNGLLKTAQGPPAGVPTTLVPPQDTTMKSEAMKCLVAILRSMGDWMNKQLRIPDPASPIVESEKNDNDGGNELRPPLLRRRHARRRLAHAAGACAAALLQAGRGHGDRPPGTRAPSSSFCSQGWRVSRVGEWKTSESVPIIIGSG